MFQRLTKGDSPADMAFGGDTIEFVMEPKALSLGPDEKVGGRTMPVRGFRLEGGPVTLEGGDDLFNHAAYTVMIDFCREKPTDSGALICFDGSFGIDVTKGGIVGWVETTRGRRDLIAHTPHTASGWHRIALTFSGEAGSAILYLDGRTMASAKDLDGAEQAGNFFADLEIGSSRGRSFPGLIDNFRFLDAALGRTDLPAL